VFDLGRARGRGISLLVALACTLSVLIPVLLLQKASASTIYSLMDSSPTGTDPGYGNAGNSGLELGVKATATRTTRITAVRFYKLSGSTQSHTANVWSSSGTNLATKAFTGESASGWQEVQLNSPVVINAGEVFTVSVYSSDYLYTNEAFPSMSVGPVSVGEGVYRYSGSSAFPSQNNGSHAGVGSNYGVDFVFQDYLICGSTGPSSKTCEVGDIGPGGGVVVQVSQYPFQSPGAACSTAGVGGTSTCTVLEAAPSGWYQGGADPLADWYMSPYLAESYAGNDSSRGQWFVPNKTQLNYLYENRNLLGIYDTYSPYGSSTEDGFMDYFYQYFSNGTVGSYDKGDPYAVRPVRGFADANTSASIVIPTDTVRATVSENSRLSITPPAGRTFTWVLFASYGTPNNYQIGACHEPKSGTIVEAALTSNSLTIYGDNNVFGDPCGGTYKRLSVIVGLNPPAATVPAAPTLISLAGGDRQITVSFTAGSNGGSAITGYKYSLNGGAFTSTGSTSSPFVISGVAGRATILLRIKAVNAVGDSDASAELSTTTTNSALDASEAAAAAQRVAERQAAEAKRLQDEADAKAKKEADDKAKAEAEAKAKKEADDKAKAEAEAKAKKEADDKAKAEADAKAKKEADDKAKAEAEAKAKKEADDKAKAEADAKAKAKEEADAKKREAEAKAEAAAQNEPAPAVVVNGTAAAAAEIASASAGGASVETVKVEGKYIASALSAGGNKAALKFVGLKVGTNIKITIKRGSN